VPQPNPYLGIANRQAEIMLRAAELGFTPSSRARLGREQPDGGPPLSDSAPAAKPTLESYLARKPDRQALN
jgi:phage terminase small subunit